MKLSEVFKDVAYSSNRDDFEVTGVTSDTRKVTDHCVFVCIKFRKFDGHNHAAEALAAGAAAVVAGRDLGLPNQIIVADTRDAYGLLCAGLHNFACRKIKLIGVTGTNGKTTITYLVKHLLEAAGKKVGLIGTISNLIDDMVLPAKYTTPETSELHALLARMAEAGCEYVVMEASSMALDQKRLAGLEFQVGIFTNLTQDHLDYHGDMDNYFAAKKKLFDHCKYGVINIDDAYGLRLLEEIPCEKVTFSLKKNEADYIAKNISHSLSGSQFLILHSDFLKRVKFCMPGDYSVQNALAAVAACVCCGLPFQEAAEGLDTCQGIRGRTEILKTDTDYTVICDYAHSPDGLEKVLQSVRSFAPARVVTLFGCAGERDRTKRPKMSRIVSELSDFIILTSDNPRSEDPDSIIQDALPPIVESGKPYIAITDRLEAIRWALHHARKDDVLILAGKGHEDYQVLKDGTVYFDEHLIVSEVLKEMRGDSH